MKLLDMSNEEILVNARKRINLTVDDIAESLGISSERVMAWESGREIIDTVDFVTIVYTYRLEFMETLYYLSNVQNYSKIPRVNQLNNKVN